MKTRIFDSIRDVPRDQWNGLLKGRSVSYVHEFWEVIENSALNDFAYRYVLFYDDADNPVALASFYTVTTDIAIFAQRSLRLILNCIRRLFPDFLKVRMLECGTPITVNSPPLISRDPLPGPELVRELGKVLTDIARSEGHFMIVVRDFEPNADALRVNLEALGYHWVDSLPNTYLQILWNSPEAYRASLKSYYRSKLQRHLRKNEEQGIRHELVDDFSALADVLCSQWMVVHHSAVEFQREILTPTFYEEFSIRLGDRTKALLLYRGQKLVGHALLLVDGDLLRWLYFGRRDPVNDSLYIYVANAVIETAIALGAKRLEMGLTTYSIKQDLGGQMTPIRLALRSPYRIVNPFIGLGYPLINHTPLVRNKNVFKKPGLDSP